MMKNEMAVAIVASPTVIMYRQVSFVFFTVWFIRVSRKKKTGP